MSEHLDLLHNVGMLRPVYPRVWIQTWLFLLFSCLALAQGRGGGGPGGNPAVPLQFVTADPSGNCTVGVPMRYNTMNGNLWGCDNGTWALAGGSSGPTGPAGGDLGGTYPNPTVTGLTHATWPGSTTQVTFNLAGAGSGDSNLTWNNTNKTLHIGTADPGFPGEILIVDTPTTLASLGVQFAENYDLNLSANETGQHVAHYSIMNMNGTGNYNTQQDAAIWGAINISTTGIVGSSSIGPVSAVAGQVAMLATTSGGVLTGVFGSCEGGFSAVLSVCAAVWGNVTSIGSTIANASDFYAQAPIAGSGIPVTFFSVFSEAVGGTATQAFPEWYDERGVWVIHSTNAFNSVYQARPALYNPQFTKFSIAQLNANSYERGVAQWESNEYVVRTEAGSGAGTLRRLGLGAAGLDVLTGDVANPLTMPKTSVAAVAPGATKCDLRLLAGTNAGTGKIVINCGTSATEVTIADNIGNGF